MSAPAAQVIESSGEELGQRVLAACRRARDAARELGVADSAARNAALLALADELEARQQQLLDANALDMAAGRDKGLDAALLDRLELNSQRIAAMAAGAREVAAQDDPLGQITDLAFRPSGIQVGRMRVALGVIGIIYESRPNVTADAAALCLKSGNATILRGGSEAINSNLAIGQCIATALSRAGLPADSVQVLDTTERAAIGHLVGAAGLVDVIVPRGGRGLVEYVAEHARVPVLKHLDGICHVYIDDRGDPVKARAVAINAKTQRYGTCCTMETLLIAQGIAPTLLPGLCDEFKGLGVELRACEGSRAIVDGLVPATEQDWATEYLAPILSIRIVDDLDAAIAHIRQYGSGHTESIVTEDYSRARRFLREVDSSSVMVNASTRFADGMEYGLGAEIGISTDKLHARGPVGVLGLTTQKFVVLGDGHIRK